MVVTPWRFDDEARRVAAQQHVELIDGPSLWAEVEPLIGFFVNTLALRVRLDDDLLRK